MKLKKLDVCAVFAVLVNGGSILQKQPILFGPSQYLVQFPDKSSNVTLGYITEGLICNLWDSGLIVGKGPSSQDDRFVNRSFYLRKSSLSDLLETLEVTPDEKLY